MKRVAGLLPQLAAEAVLETKADYIELNTVQLSKGLDRNGEEIELDGSSEYALSTIKRKQRLTGLGSITDHITLFDKGALYELESWSLEVMGDDIFLDFDIYYGGYILRRTTEIVMGLNAESKTAYKEILEPTFMLKVKQQL